MPRAYLVVLPGILAIAAAGCFPDTGSHAVEIFTEMHYQQSYRSQEPPRLLPPDGAVPVTGREVAYTAAQAMGLENPVPRTGDTLKRGRTLYSVNCSVCHGRDGRGDGPMADFLVKWQYVTPPNLTAATAQGKADGQIFSIITDGVFVMPNFGKLLTEEERWTLVHYLRSIAGQ